MKKSKKQKMFNSPEFKQINFNAAGIDIGAEVHVSVPEGRDPEGRDVRSTFTSDLYVPTGYVDTVQWNPQAFTGFRCLKYQKGLMSN